MKACHFYFSAFTQFAQILNQMQRGEAWRPTYCVIRGVVVEYTSAAKEMVSPPPFTSYLGCGLIANDPHSMRVSLKIRLLSYFAERFL